VPLFKNWHASFLNKDFLSRKNLSRAIFAGVNYLSSALVKENLSYFPFTLLRETFQGKTCQGELASVYTVNKFFLTKGLVKENLLA